MFTPSVDHNACQVDELAGAFEKVCEACSAFQDYVTIYGFMGKKIEELHVFVKFCNTGNTVYCCQQFLKLGATCRTA